MKTTLTDINRRALVERFASAALGVNLLPGLGVLHAAETGNGGKAKSVILLYMRGGISHIDTFDPKPGRPEMIVSLALISLARSGKTIALYRQPAKA